MSESIIHGSSKTYNHSVGLSCCFRQWRAQSHCNKLHGYALKIRLDFEAQRLNDTNWVVDFGGFRNLKEWLEACFDHKTLVAADDPQISWFKEGVSLGTIDVVFVAQVGCEAFSELIFGMGQTWLQNRGYSPRVRLVKVEVSEHDGNSGWTRIIGSKHPDFIGWDK